MDHGLVENFPDTTLRFIGSLEDQGKLFSEVSLARAKFGTASKDIKGQIGNQSFKYADLHSLVEASRAALGDHGVSVCQFLTGTGENCLLTTVLAGHGAQVHALLEFPKPGDVKEFGRVTTYLRRYQFQALFVLDGDRDADADAAPAPMRQEKRREPPPVLPAQQQRQAAPVKVPSPPNDWVIQGNAQKPAVQAVRQPSARPPEQLKLSSIPPKPASVAPASPVTSMRPPAMPTPPPEPIVTVAKDGPPTNEQKATLRQLADDMHLSKMQISGWCQERYNCSPRELNEGTADDLVMFLRHMQDEAQSA